MINKFAEYTKEEMLKVLTDRCSAGLHSTGNAGIHEIMVRLTELKYRKAIPLIEKFLNMDNLSLRACAVHCLEEFGRFKSISHSGLSFPGTLTRDEITVCLKLIDKETLDYISKLWNPFEKDRVLQCAGKPGFNAMVNSFRSYSTFLNYSSKPYSKSIERVNMIIDLLSRSGDIKPDVELTGAQLRKLMDSTPDVYVKYLEETREKRELKQREYRENLKKDRSVKKLKSAIVKIGPVSVDKDVYIEFFDNAFEVSRRHGLLYLEEFVGEINNEMLKQGIQMICNGVMEEDAVHLLGLKKRKLMHEYDTLLDLIINGVAGITKYGVPDHYREIIRSY